MKPRVRAYRTFRRRVLVIAVAAIVGLFGIGVLSHAWPASVAAGGTLPAAPVATATSPAPPVATAASPGTTPSALYQSWTPPSDMPANGDVVLLSGDQRIPSTAGFQPRDASVYLPPAALVQDPPALPLVVFMMGQPGDPDPEPIRTAMDALAATHNGLAPIVIIADQLGDPNSNPACVDSAAFGGVEHYFTVDIPAWARTNLHIQQDVSAWTIAGFSNGGGCALDWGLAHPDLWGNIVSIAGESHQGTEFPDEVLQDAFGGDSDAYTAAEPTAKAEANAGRFTGHVAVFAAGADDAFFGEQVQLSAQLTEQSGFQTTVFSIPAEDHTGALAPGLLSTFGALFWHLQLAPPSG